MNVIGYTRVSTDGQCGDDKFGLEVQRSQIEDYCRRNDMTVVRWVSDEGESGERFADTVARLGFDYVQDKLLTAPIDKEAILNKNVVGGATC